MYVFLIIEMNTNKFRYELDIKRIKSYINVNVYGCKYNLNIELNNVSDKN